MGVGEWEGQTDILSMPFIVIECLWEYVFPHHWCFPIIESTYQPTHPPSSEPQDHQEIRDVGKHRVQEGGMVGSRCGRGCGRDQGRGGGRTHVEGGGT